MKFLSIAIYVIHAFLSCLLFGCKNLPDNHVLLAFQEKFPDTKNVIWEEENEGWEAHFNIQGVEHWVDFDITGKWLETEKQIVIDEIPEIVMNALKTKYSGSKVYKVYVEENQDGVIYEFEFKEEDMEVEIDESGNFLHQDNDE